MAFFDHVDEMRVRLMKSLVVFIAGFSAAYFVAEPILAFLRVPLFQALPPEQQKLYFTSLFENFMTHLKISGYASIFFCSPYFFYQIWAFVAPGLYPKERRLALPFILATTFFFIAGAAFAYYVLFPVGFKYFVTYGGPTDVPMLTIDSYYSTVLKLMLIFGLAFELPVLVVFLGYVGVVTPELLRTHRKAAVIGITALSAVAAPPDAISMLMLMAPLILMYEMSILVVQAIHRRRLKPRQTGS
jgi:sec-independent protein translocase protein TatC